MKKTLLKVLKVLLFLVVGLVTLLALVLAIENYRGKRAWEACRAELEAKGEKLDWAALAPPPVPDDQNFYKTPLLAPLTDLVPDPATRGQSWTPRDSNAVQRINALFGSLEPALRTERGSWRLGQFTALGALQTALRGATNTRNAELQHLMATPPAAPEADLLALFAMKSSELAELRAALNRPHARTGSSAPGSIMEMPHLGTLRGFGRALALKALAELAANHPDEAATDVVSVLRLGRVLEAEPLLIAALVEVAMVETGIQPLWEGLARHEWQEPQLAVFETELAKLDFVAGMGRALRFERVFSLGMLESWRNPPAGAGVDGVAPGFIPGPRYLPGGWIRQSQVHIARMFQDFLIPVLDTNRKVIDEQLGNRLELEAKARLEGWSPYKVMARMLFPAINRVSQKGATAQTAVNQARIAVALERFRLAHSSYPEELAALAPKFLPVVPHDVLNGEPYRYRHEAPDHVALYSVGLNLKDDAGQVAVTRQGRPSTAVASGDWVWQNFAVTNTVTNTPTSGL